MVIRIKTINKVVADHMVRTRRRMSVGIVEEATGSRVVFTHIKMIPEMRKVC